uniref:Reverse transcriptase domain-containing protein n=1 Tax=Photinus pyralis TaxID=7054 RepID=A0A1Y1LYJ1_PHOPY
MLTDMSNDNRTQAHTRKNKKRTNDNIKHHKLNIGFWNLSGISNLFNLDTTQINLLKIYDIICLVETWALNESIELPTAFNEYNYIASAATKEKSMGRASGGLVILYKQCIHLNTIEKTNLWVIAQAKHGNGDFIIMANYWKPTADIDFCTKWLDETIRSLKEEYLSSQLLIIGDFNARVGTMNQWEENSITNPNVSHERSTRDSKVNRRGRKLMEIMDAYGMILLNGRTQSDTPADYTYLSETGKSVIDLVFVDDNTINNINDMTIMDPLHTSNHMLAGIDVVCHWGEEDGTKSTTSKGITPISQTVFNRPSMTSQDFAQQMAMSNRIYFFNDNTEAVSKNIEHALKETAQILNLTKSFSPHSRKRDNNCTWYDATCRNLKKEWKQTLRKFKSERTQQFLQIYLMTKRRYFSLLKQKKQAFNDRIWENIENVQNSSAFWKTVRRYGKTKNQNCPIQTETWYQFLKDLYTTRRIEITLYPNITHPHLDAAISLSEIEWSINHLKLNKSPGPDGIPNEYYKSLPSSWIHYLQTLFNRVLQTEDVPQSWANVKMQMVFKKGDRMNPHNYRSIALLNSITKLFTNIIYNRLYKWCEENNVLPDEQAGFRKGRGCSENIFILNAAVSINTAPKSSYLYAIFVDFQKAFDTINHSKLWNKLHAIGISSKIIRTVKAIYEKTKITINNNLESTEAIDMTTGVMQGDCLSPLLFAIYISDIISYYQKNHCDGVKLTHIRSLIMLLYADDAVIFANNVFDANRKLNILNNYCEENKLTININKTKVMAFHRGRKKKTLGVFVFNNSTLEIVEEYTYLGITFSSSGVFKKACESFIEKSSRAIARVKSTLIKVKSECFTVQRYGR